jgi:hypothetical protein
MTSTNDEFRRLFLDEMKLLHAELDRIWATAQTLPLGTPCEDLLAILLRKGDGD